MRVLATAVETARATAGRRIVANAVSFFTASDSWTST